jgi:hypothetical protein
MPLNLLCSACSVVSFASLQMYAVKAGAACRPLVQLLLSKGVDRESAIPSRSAAGSCSLGGLTALHLLVCCCAEIAYVTQSVETFELSEMIRHAVNVSAASDAKFRAMYEQQLLVAADLLVGPCCCSSSSSGSKRVADVNARTHVHGETPLTFAAYAGAVEVAHLLLIHGANPNLPRLVDGSRPLDLAAKFAGPKLACTLIEHGAEVSQLAV